MKTSEVLEARVGDAHITPEQIADVNIGTYGPDDYVLDTGRQMEAELVTNNTLRIFDGVMVYCGIRDVVSANDYHDVTIENGSQGMNRNDIVARHFKIDATSGYGSSEFVVIKGTSSSGTAEDPVVEVTDLRSGALEHYFPLYRVKLEGLSVVTVEPLFNVCTSMAKIQRMVDELNSKFSYSSDKVVRIGRWGSSWNLSETKKNIGSKLAAVDNEYYTTTTGEASTITIKQSGLYFVTMYAQGAAASGASAGIEATVNSNNIVFDDEYVLFNNQYSYGGLAASSNASRMIYLPAGTVLTPYIRKTASSTATTTGSSYLEVTKIA